MRRHHPHRPAYLAASGSGLDVPVGERLFFRASARMVLFQVEVGVGVKF